MSIPRAAQPRWTTTAPRTQSPAAHRGPDGEQHIWVDGSVLSIAPVGHFNLVVGLVQSLLRWDDGRCAVHVVATREGHRRMLARLEGEKRRPLLHAHCRPQPGSIEVIVWKGRFRQRRSLKIAIVPDLTTRIHPELHTPNNIADFERYLAHVLRRANTIATVSRSSRQDILARLPLYPESVAILPVAVSPLYLAESYPEEVLARLNVAKPYLLFVGTVEPRKNLRRLVEAFERIVEAGGPPHLSLVLAGPNGWDEGFDEFLARRPRAATVRRLGQVDIADLPSLYHHAAAVVYPSLYEGYGLPVLEGMCCGGAVLASRVSSMPEVLGEDGLYFDPRDVADIAGTIRGVLRLGPDADRLYRALLRSRAEDILTRAATEPPLQGLEPEAMP